LTVQLKLPTVECHHTGGLIERFWSFCS